MSKFIKTKILLFIVIVVAGDYVGGAVMQRVFLKTKFRYAMLYNGELPADIVVLGNSRGLHMFHPPSIESVTGSKVVSLAFNGLPTVAMPILWEDYLARHKAPKLLIVEVSCVASQHEPGSLERLSLLADQNPQFGELILSENFNCGLGNRVSRLHRYNSNLTWRSLMFLRRSDQSWIMNTDLNAETMSQLIAESDNRLRKISSNVDAIKKVVAIAKDANVEVKLIFAPYHPDFHQRLEDPCGWADWLQIELGHEIHDQTQLLTDQDHFSDHIHLNEAGALELARRIEMMGHFTPLKR